MVVVTVCVRGLGKGGKGGSSRLRDVGLVALEERFCGEFSAYICWINGGF